MVKKIIISMDLEPDLTKYLQGSFLGMDSLPKFLDILDIYNVKCDFFVTSNIALKFSDLIKNIKTRGHYIGCHGSDHNVEYYCKKSYEWQKKDIENATKAIEKILETKIQMFRTPSFSVNEDTIKALEQIGYKIDSSVLPGRIVRKWRLFTIYDFKTAPLGPYTPSLTDINKKGESKILEVPLTGNPAISGAPMGVGYLNIYGLEKTIDLVNKIDGEYITFLLHPWELIDLGKARPDIPEGWKEGCKENYEELEKLLKYFKQKYEFGNIVDVYTLYNKDGTLS